MKNVQSFQSVVVKKEKIDSDFEDLVSAGLKVEDDKAIVALTQLYSHPSNFLHNMFHEEQIMKSVPSIFQTVLKKIKRINLIPIIDNFYKNFTDPTEESIHHKFESLHQIMTLITTSLLDLEYNYKSVFLISLLADMEKVFFQANWIYESIQDTLLEFSDTQPTGIYFLYYDNC